MEVLLFHMQFEILKCFHFLTAIPQQENWYVKHRRKVLCVILVKLLMLVFDLVEQTCMEINFPLVRHPMGQDPIEARLRDAVLMG